MNKSDKKNFAALLVAVSEVKGKPISEAAANLYFGALADLPFAVVEKAIGEVMKTHRYATLPSPADIRFAALGDPEVRPSLAWDEVMKAYRDHGYNKSVQFADGTIASVILALDGWPAVCEAIGSMDEKSIGFYRKEFRRLYQVYERRGDNPSRVLIGWSDRQNIFNGYTDPETLVNLLTGKPIDVPLIGITPMENGIGLPQLPNSNTKAIDYEDTTSEEDRRG